jgi:nucleoside-diphosphate-sugar epimerase
MSNYFNTGVGFIGSNLWLLFLAKGYSVITDNLSGGFENIEHLLTIQILVYCWDITNLQTCENAVATADYVLHQALGSVPCSIIDPIANQQCKCFWILI